MQMRRLLTVCALTFAGVLAWGGLPAHARQDQDQDRQGQDQEGQDDQGDGQRVRQVFVIAMENHNWTQPGGPGTGSPQQIFQNIAAPFINSLVNGSSIISSQVSYAENYQNPGQSVHPSEPNYVWTEAGQPEHSLGTDLDPWSSSCAVQTVVNDPQHLSRFIERGGKTWRSYQEDANLDATKTNTPLPMAQWRAPIASVSGLFVAPGVNAYNYSAQFNYAAKHNPQVFFLDTNGGSCTAGSPAIGALMTNYPPLQQLQLDLISNRLADYTWITPNQFNDQHSILATGYGQFPAGSDQAAIAQGDNFLSRVVPMIMASQAYKHGAAILLWWDESEGGDTAQFKIPFIVISKHAHKNVGGVPYASSVLFSHSSFLRTMQEIFNVDPDEGFPFLGGAVSANDLRDLFAPGAIK